MHRLKRTKALCRHRRLTLVNSLLPEHFVAISKHSKAVSSSLRLVITDCSNWEKGHLFAKQLQANWWQSLFKCYNCIGRNRFHQLAANYHLNAQISQTPKLIIFFLIFAFYYFLTLALHCALLFSDHFCIKGALFSGRSSLLPWPGSCRHFEI